MVTKGYLGIDAGTQGLSAVFVNEDLEVLATGEGSYAMISDLAEGCYEQRPADWESALQTAVNDVRNQLHLQRIQWDVVAIGISGQMHGEVLADAGGKSLGPARLWCDSRNELEGDELTERFGVKMPKRITAARWLWTIRNQPDKAHAAARMTTPGGWLAYRLTGQWILGIGDASGMFPINQSSGNYDESKLKSFDELAGTAVNSIKTLLPTVRRAGEDGGSLNEHGAKLLGLKKGIPVAPAEGDQPASLAGALIGTSGTVSVSYGTSVCANSVGDREFAGVNQAVDHFCAPDGKPINMVWLRNGTTFLNTVVGMFGAASGGNKAAGFEFVVPQLMSSSPDCDGVLAFPFMDDEPGLGISQGGTAMFVGLNPDNSTVGNLAKAALLATMFNLRLGSEVLEQQGFPRNELVLSGGLTKTPDLGQVLADVFGTTVVLLQSADEGCAWGAAILAKYRFAKLQGEEMGWSDFLSAITTDDRIRFTPQSDAVKKYDATYHRYKRLMKLQPELDKAVR